MELSPKYFNVFQPAEYVTHVEINRPQKMNAFVKEMWLELHQIFTHLSTSPNTRAIILSGAGPSAFTTGLDVGSAANDPLLHPNKTSGPSSTACDPSSSSTHAAPLDPARSATNLRRHVSEFQSCISAVESCEKPVIAALHGYCLGLGIDLSLCADVRICTSHTRFAVKEVDIGLAADIGTLSRLPKVVGGGSWVKDVCLSGRTFGAAEAKRVGLVSWAGQEGGSHGKTERGRGDGGKEEVVRKAVEWAVLIARKSPVAVQGTKELLNWSWDRRVGDGLRYTAVWNSAMLQGRDTTEAMNAVLKKRAPRFEKL